MKVGVIHSPLRTRSVNDGDPQLAAHIQNRTNLRLANLPGTIYKTFQGEIIPAINQNKSSFLQRQVPAQLSITKIRFMGILAGIRNLSPVAYGYLNMWHIFSLAV